MATRCPPLLGLPLEIRLEIYQYLAEDEIASRGYQLKGSNIRSLEADISYYGPYMNFGYGTLGYHDGLTSLFRTNHQLRDEVRAIWLQHNAISLKDDGLQLQKTFAWFQRVTPRNLKLIREVFVGVNNISEPCVWVNPLPWLRIEEVAFSQHIHIRLCLHETAQAKIWQDALNAARRCRATGMDWKQIESVMRDMRQRFSFRTKGEGQLCSYMGESRMDK